MNLLLMHDQTIPPLLVVSNRKLMKVSSLAKTGRRFLSFVILRPDDSLKLNRNIAKSTFMIWSLGAYHYSDYPYICPQTVIWLSFRQKWISSGLFYAWLGVIQPYLYEISSLISTVIIAVSEKKNSVWKTSNLQCYHFCSVIIFFLCCMMKWFLRKRSLSLVSRKSHQRSGYTNSRMTWTFSPDFMQYCSSVPNEVG